jgi:putative transposase
MSDYRRLYINGGCYFFTLVTYHREPILCSQKAIHRIKAAFKYTKKKYPFHIKALVLLPDHLHCILTLPENDANFSIRWNLVKRYFSIGMNGEVNHRREKISGKEDFGSTLLKTIMTISDV